MGSSQGCSSAQNWHTNGAAVGCSCVYLCVWSILLKYGEQRGNGQDASNIESVGELHYSFKCCVGT